MPVHMKTGIVLSDRFRIDNVTLKKIRFETRDGWIRRHTFTMFQGHGNCLPEGPTGRSTSYTSIYRRIRGL